MFSRTCSARRSIAPSPHACGRTPPARRSAGLSGPSRAVTAGIHRPGYAIGVAVGRQAQVGASICSSKGVTPIVPAHYEAWRGPGARTPLGVFRSAVSHAVILPGAASAAPHLPSSYCCETSGLLEQLGSRTALTSGSSRFFWVTRVEPVSMSSSWASLRMASMAALVPS